MWYRATQIVSFGEGDALLNQLMDPHRAVVAHEIEPDTPGCIGRRR